MREMEIPPFPRKFDNPDLGDFLRQRLSQTSVLWPEQAIPLVGRSADALITPSIDAIESRPPAENTAKKQRGRPFKAGRSGCRRALLYGEAKAIARHRKKKRRLDSALGESGQDSASQQQSRRSRLYYRSP